MPRHSPGTSFWAKPAAKAVADAAANGLHLSEAPYTPADARVAYKPVGHCCGLDRELVMPFRPRLHGIRVFPFLLNHTLILGDNRMVHRFLPCDDGGRARRRAAAKLLTPDEAHRIAVNIAKLPKLLINPSWPCRERAAAVATLMLTNHVSALRTSRRYRCSASARTRLLTVWQRRPDQSAQSAAVAKPHARGAEGPARGVGALRNGRRKITIRRPGGRDQRVDFGFA